MPVKKASDLLYMHTRVKQSQFVRFYPFLFSSFLQIANVLFALFGYVILNTVVVYMTMILTCLTKDYVVQASDRRLTYRIGRKKEHSNKALIYRNRFAFAFTGLAELPIKINGKTIQQSTIDWAANRLSEGKDLDNAVEHLRRQLTDLMNTNMVRKIPEEDRRLAFVGGGFEEVEEAGQMVRKPRRIIISNYLENDGTMLKTVSNRFSVDSYRQEDDRYISLDVKGQ